jgi:Immunity protein 8
MKAQLKHLHSPDVDDLQAFCPQDPTTFRIFVQAMIGPEGEDSSESFDISVCTPSWLAAAAERDGPVIGLHHVIVATFDYDALFKSIQSFCSRCDGASWQEVGAKLGKLGRWEFDEYRQQV